VIQDLTTGETVDMLRASRQYVLGLFLENDCDGFSYSALSVRGAGLNWRESRAAGFAVTEIAAWKRRECLPAALPRPAQASRELVRWSTSRCRLFYRCADVRSVRRGHQPAEASSRT